LQRTASYPSCAASTMWLSRWTARCMHSGRSVCATGISRSSRRSIRTAMRAASPACCTGDDPACGWKTLWGFAAAASVQRQAVNETVYPVWCSGKPDGLMAEIPTAVVDPLPKDVPDGVRRSAAADCGLAVYVAVLAAKLSLQERLTRSTVVRRSMVSFIATF
jgi:hypothetical protein